jgi:two-component system sensor histidine kinase HydH
MNDNSISCWTDALAPIWYCDIHWPSLPVDLRGISIMRSWMPQFRLLFPLLLTSSISFFLCGAIAVFLLREQSQSAEALGETIASFRASAKLEESLLDLIALLRTQVEDVRALHERIDSHLGALVRHANTKDEIEACEELIESFQSYLVVWRSLGQREGDEHVIARREALRVLEQETLRPCQDLRDSLNRQIDSSQQEHRATVRSLAWGLAAVGGSAVLAGLFLGYGAARGLNQSIQRLQIGIRDAAGKLAHALPTIEFREGSNLNQLHEQMQFLIGSIEQTVQQLQQRERELLRAEQLAAVGQLAAGMAHEIRNPLMSIKMLIQAAREEGPSEGLYGEDLVVIEREIRQMQRSIQSFLDFARPPKLHKTELEVGKVLTRTIELIRGRAEKQNVMIATDFPPRSPLLQADASQLQQVVLNLALNALDVMPTGGTLSLGIRAANTKVEITVADTGPGIPSDVRDRLFQPFVTTKPTGLGLGLVISRRIVEDHGGRLDADNIPGRGACFRILLPTHLQEPEPGLLRIMSAGRAVAADY